ncbi:MAG: UDP-N-acetylmuramoyl-L-alanine--D-glutamate ligase [Bacteroidales bacterium]
MNTVGSGTKETAMAEFTVRGKRAVVIGGARSGVAAALLLHDRGAAVTVTDSKETIRDAALLKSRGVSVQLGTNDPTLIVSADVVVTSPGVPWHLPVLDQARAAGVEVLGEVELASRWLKGRIVAITGTKGKSTTTTLVGRMLRAAGKPGAVAGNIGDALAGHVSQSTPDSIHVVEVSSFQLEATSTFHPWIAALLNFSPDHLDRHATVDEYAAAKQRVFTNQDEDDWAVVNLDDPETARLAAASPARRAWFGLDTRPEDGVTVDGGAVCHVAHGTRTPLIPLSSVRLIGRHLLADVVAAAAIARIAGVGSDSMVRAVEGFGGLEHAMELVAEHRGVRFVNDSKATNVESARRAIESFDRGLVPIMGGRFKGGDLRELREPLRARARAVVAIGEARARLRAAFEGAVAVHEAETMRDAVERGFELAEPDGTVLLAPACASFDMFADYAERGRVFKQEVERIVGR